MENKNSEKLVKYVVSLLKEARQMQAISYSKLAAKAGIHYTTISFIERGIQLPSLLICSKLCNALGLKLSELIKKAEDNL